MGKHFTIATPLRQYYASVKGEVDLPKWVFERLIDELNITTIEELYAHVKMYGWRQIRRLRNVGAMKLNRIEQVFEAYQKEQKLKADKIHGTRLGYYAKDQDENLYRFVWDKEIFKIYVAGAYVEQNPEDYEILEIGFFTADD